MPSNQAAESEFYTKILVNTYCLEEVQFICSQPANSLIEGITAYEIPVAKCIAFNFWPKA
jgi:hypothetical protein